jgi:hypothetical protein
MKYMSMGFFPTAQSKRGERGDVVTKRQTSEQSNRIPTGLKKNFSQKTDENVYWYHTTIWWTNTSSGLDPLLYHSAYTS